jgi:hypothetical protein
MLALSSYFFYDYRYFYFQPTKGGARSYFQTIIEI